jgi:hypothetical protein
MSANHGAAACAVLQEERVALSFATDHVPAPPLKMSTVSYTANHIYQQQKGAQTKRLITPMEISWLHPPENKARPWSGGDVAVK